MFCVGFKVVLICNWNLFVCFVIFIVNDFLFCLNLMCFCLFSFNERKLKLCLFNFRWVVFLVLCLILSIEVINVLFVLSWIFK